MKKVILHLCADIGSDSRFYDLSDDYEVIRIGAEIGVENYMPPANVHGVIANPPCTDLSRARIGGKARDIDKGMFLVNHCLRIIDECNPVWWVLENPATGALRTRLGAPKYEYQPWQYGSPWTKKTALWGNFNAPEPLFKNWEDVPKIAELYIRKPYTQKDGKVKAGATKPAMILMHKSAKKYIREMDWASDRLNDDAALRSWCSQGFAEQFFLVNK